MFYLDLFSALDRHGVDYTVIGGLAVALHGVERATMDIDVAVAMTAKNLAALVDVARELGLTPALPVPLLTLTDIDLLSKWHAERRLQAFALCSPDAAGISVDVLLFPPVAFPDLHRRSVVFDVAGVPVRVVAVEDLIALKEAAGRSIDRSDVEHLKRLKGL